MLPPHLGIIGKSYGDIGDVRSFGGLEHPMPFAQVHRKLMVRGIHLFWVSAHQRYGRCIGLQGFGQGRADGSARP